jgi:hypothetical protein
MNPTPAELKAANLVAEAPPLVNGEPIRSWDSVHQNFPPIETVYVTPAVVPPPPTPPPTPVTASGIPIPPVAAGMTRSLVDDFETTTLSSVWDPDYNGESGGAIEKNGGWVASIGYFCSSHTVLKGDSLLRLEAYPDPVNIVKCYEYTASQAAAVNQWAGAGVQVKSAIGPGSVETVCMKFDVYPGIAPMAIDFGSGEIDWAEFGGITAKGPITKFAAAIHWDNQSQQQQIEIVAPTGVDFSQWGAFRRVWTDTGVTISHSVDGVNFVECGSFTFSAAQISGGLTTPQYLCLQIQTGDGGSVLAPPADPSVTASTPVTMYVDWVTVDVA